ncbi:MAG: hypothetical protein HKN47_05560 [Pirellulaceae bacterium]|nr:hypothetical protein [Pirellulaceae bacterium]
MSYDEHLDQQQVLVLVVLEPSKLELLLEQEQQVAQVLRKEQLHSHTMVQLRNRMLVQQHSRHKPMHKVLRNRKLEPRHNRKRVQRHSHCHIRQQHSRHSSNQHSSISWHKRCQTVWSSDHSRCHYGHSWNPNRNHSSVHKVLRNRMREQRHSHHNPMHKVLRNRKQEQHIRQQHIRCRIRQQHNRCHNRHSSSRHRTVSRASLCCRTMVPHKERRIRSLVQQHNRRHNQQLRSHKQVRNCIRHRAGHNRHRASHSRCFRSRKMAQVLHSHCHKEQVRNRKQQHSHRHIQRLRSHKLVRICIRHRAAHNRRRASHSHRHCFRSRTMVQVLHSNRRHIRPLRNHKLAERHNRHPTSHSRHQRIRIRTKDQRHSHCHSSYCCCHSLRQAFGPEDQTRNFGCRYCNQVRVLESLLSASLEPRLPYCYAGHLFLSLPNVFTFIESAGFVGTRSSDEVADDHIPSFRSTWRVEP